MAAEGQLRVTRGSRAGVGERRAEGRARRPAGLGCEAGEEAPGEPGARAWGRRGHRRPDGKEAHTGLPDQTEVQTRLPGLGTPEPGSAWLLWVVI